MNAPVLTEFATKGERFAGSLFCPLAALILSAGLFSAPVLALDPAKTLSQYAHRIWGQEEGLFQPTIYSILQTSDGFLWLGTQDSLIRFDGAHFREFDGASQTAFHNSPIRALLEDEHGNLWVGSIGAGIARIGPNSQLTRYTTKEGLPSDTVFCLAPGAKDELWVCTNQGLARFSGGRFRAYTTADGCPPIRSVPPVNPPMEPVGWRALILA